MPCQARSPTIPLPEDRALALQPKQVPNPPASPGREPARPRALGTAQKQPRATQRNAWGELGRTLQALSRAGRLGVCFLAYNSQISRSRAASSSSSPAVNEPLGAANRCQGQWFKPPALASCLGQRQGMG